jgi:hypothetical protein
MSFSFYVRARIGSVFTAGSLLDFLRMADQYV